MDAPPVAAQSLPAAAIDSHNPTSPTFLRDGAHLAPGVTLRLAALRRGEALTPVDAVLPTDNGTRVQYAHGDVHATEWYLRQGGGIEQGITLAAPPIGDGPLSLTIATPGAVVPVNDAGDAATLLLPDKTRWQIEPGAASNDNFGFAVAMSTDGSVLAVGAFGVSTFQGKVHIYTKIIRVYEG